MSGMREKRSERLDPLQVAGGALTVVLALSLAGCGGAASTEVKTPLKGDARTMMAPQERQNYEESMKNQKSSGGRPGMPGGGGPGMPGGGGPGMPGGAQGGMPR